MTQNVMLDVQDDNVFDSNEDEVLDLEDVHVRATLERRLRAQQPMYFANAAQDDPARGYFRSST